MYELRIYHLNLQMEQIHKEGQREKCDQFAAHLFLRQKTGESLACGMLQTTNPLSRMKLSVCSICWDLSLTTCTVLNETTVLNEKMTKFIIQKTVVSVVSQYPHHLVLFVLWKRMRGSIPLYAAYFLFTYLTFSSTFITLQISVPFRPSPILK